MHDFIRWFLEFTGADNVSGSWYGFWSGFGGDIPILGGLFVYIYRHNCHVPGCFRLSIHHHKGPTYCKKHSQQAKL